MFDFFDMAGTHEQRKVDRFERDDLIVDTCSVTDSDDPYETAISHPDYNDGKWVIAETYKTADAAQEGHDKWVQIMTAPEIPAQLVDVSTFAIAELFRAIDPDGLTFEAKG